MTHTAPQVSGSAVAVAPDATPQTSTGTPCRAAPDRASEQHPTATSRPHYSFSPPGGQRRIAGA